MARQFRWLSSGGPPARVDLRRCGWQLVDPADARTGDEPCPLLAELRGIGAGDWLDLLSSARPTRARTFLLGVDDPLERARLLRLGFGDVADRHIRLAELDVRLHRVAERVAMLPRSRWVGPLRLDLLHREAVVADRALGLHPREFALLWRLAECPGTPVAPHRLLADVWQLSFRPETNSLAVHVSRLRAKLRLAGIDGMVETAPDGAYRLVAAQGPIPDPPRDLALDAYLRIGEEQHKAEQDQPA